MGYSLKVLDPNVWTRRALQEKAVRWGVQSCTNVSGLELELMLWTIMEIRARPTLLTATPRRAHGVIRSRVRWKDHFSISSVSLPDLGGKRVYMAFSPCLLAANSAKLGSCPSEWCNNGEAVVISGRAGSIRLPRRAD